MSYADFVVILIMALSAGSAFMAHDCHARDQSLGMWVAYSAQVLTLGFAICNAPAFNQAYFHFSGVVGNIMAAIMICVVFAEPPRRAMDFLCRYWLFRKTSQV